MDNKRKVVLQKVLSQILRKLQAQYQPEKVILFGSLAQDEVDTWSDIDLLIVKKTETPFWQRIKEVALLCQAPVAVDYLVYTPSELSQMIADNNPFILNILEKGTLVYEQESIPAVA